MSYGQLALLVLTLIIHTHTHKLSQVEEWGHEHHHTLELSTGWQIGAKDLTDDRLGRLMEVLGEDEAQSAAYQQQQSQHWELARQEEPLAGLVPGNLRMHTARPSAERLLVAFDYLHLLITTSSTQCEGQLVEPLSALQQRILALLQLPETIYRLESSNICVT